ncbi:MAG: xanthine dehydrogenase family protein [Candidatus Tectomicrobia bacterium]|nr:xanthine dehydrogenase family protein [Candidatus Tectomicrobia bacterium]
MQHAVVGRTALRVDAIEKVTGAAVYGVDVTLPRMLHGKILRSRLPHARILHIDTAKARALPGVKAVITAADMPGIPMGFMDFVRESWADCLPLKSDKVRYRGDEVAAVAAIDADIAEEALDLIEVEYEELEPVYDPLAAMAEGAPLVHEHRARNIAASLTMGGGDLDEGLRAAERVFEHTFSTQAQAHCCLEPRQSVIRPEPDGRLTLWASTQMPFILRHELAHALGLPDSRVRVIKTHLGAGFGSRMEMHCIDPICGRLAQLTNRPVKIVYDREEEFVATRTRHPFRMTLRSGVKRDGTLTARHFSVVVDSGAYLSQAPGVTSVAGGLGLALYRVPHTRFEAKMVYTNKPYGGAFRGYGNPQVTFAIESQMDIIACELGIEPAELRRRNANGPNETTPLGHVITSCGLRESLDDAQGRGSASLGPALDAARPAAGSEAARSNGRRFTRRGLGLACLFHVGGGARFHGDTDGCGVILKLDDDGSLSLISGAGDLGQGLATVQTQVAAEELGVPLDHIRFFSGDTDLTPWDVGIHASRGTFVAGNAVRLAGRKLREKLFAFAAELLEADAADLRAADGRVFVQGAPDRSVSLAEVARAAHYREGGTTLMAEAFYDPPTQLPGRHGGNSSAAYAFGTHAAEVEVDEETGIVRVVRLTASHDIGFPINPQGAEGQVEGGAVQGMGFGLMEEMRFGGGTTLNSNFLDYKFPTVLDVPEVTAHWIITEDPEGPYGAKGIAEPAIIPPAPAIANAVYHATGARVFELPLTPERVLRALREAKRASPK